jgi:5-methylthioadenosine/S-adenosylhomocysteine deaminase
VTRLVLHNAHVVSLDETVGELPRADVLIEGDTIMAVETDLSGVDGDHEDLDGGILIPGMIDMHRHVWQAVLRNVAADWTLSQYFSGVRGQLGAHFTAEDVYAGTLAGALEALSAGVTTVLDWSHNMNTPDHADATVDAWEAAGGRALLCYGNSNEEWLPVSSLPTNYADARRIREDRLPSSEGLITMGLAVRGPQYATPEVTERDFLFARDLDIPISVHVGDGAWGKNRPVEWLRDRGLLSDRLVCAHCNALAVDEFAMLKEAGAAVVMTPLSELQMGHGWPATRNVLDAGMAPTLGVDIVTCSGGDLFQVMRTTLLVERAFAHQRADERGEEVETLPITAGDILRFATVNGAAALHLEHKVGRIAPGLQADMVLIHTDNLEMTPVNDAVGAVVLAAHPGLVDSVWVAGRRVKRAGRLVGVDERRVIDLVNDARTSVLERAGVQAGGTFTPAPYVVPDV